MPDQFNCAGCAGWGIGLGMWYTKCVGISLLKALRLKEEAVPKWRLLGIQEGMGWRCRRNEDTHNAFLMKLGHSLFIELNQRSNRTTYGLDPELGNHVCLLPACWEHFGSDKMLGHKWAPTSDVPPCHLKLQANQVLLPGPEAEWLHTPKSLRGFLKWRRLAHRNSCHPQMDLTQFPSHPQLWQKIMNP